MLATRLLTVPPSLTEVASLDSSLVDLVCQLQTLSVQQRAVVVLRYVGGLSTAEIADVLHTTAGTVRVQLHRAHGALRVTMEEPDGR